MEKHFKEAVDLAAQFNTEQAGAIITGKIDPLLTKALTELTAFVALQKQHTQDAVAEANASRKAVETATAIAGGVVLCLAGLMA